MEIQQLKYFVNVAHLRNFTRAAERCRVAQPSLSQQIQKLEQELGSPLFHRQGKKIILTELGKMLLPKAEKILKVHEESLLSAQEFLGESGMVRFGAILTIAPYLIPKLLPPDTFQGEAKLEIHEDFTENLLRKLKEGELDFAIMSTPVDEPGLLVRVIAQEPFVAVMPSEHPLGKKRKLSLGDIFASPFLPLSKIHCAGKQISEICQLGTQSIHTTHYQVTQIETILRLISEGAGVTILPQMAINTQKRKDLIFRKISNKTMLRDITLVHHQDRYLSKFARSMIQRIETLLNKKGDS